MPRSTPAPRCSGSPRLSRRSRSASMSRCGAGGVIGGMAAGSSSGSAVGALDFVIRLADETAVNAMKPLPLVRANDLAVYPAPRGTPRLHGDAPVFVARWIATRLPHYG